jgi:predicted DNA-binding transcriptional regulator AlpA
MDLVHEKRLYSTREFARMLSMDKKSIYRKRKTKRK